MLFDIDGTLLMAGGAGRSTIDAIVEEHYGVANALSDVRLHGNTDPLILEEVARRHAREESEVFLPVLRRKFLERMPSVLADRCTLLPGVREFLDRLLAQGVPLGVVTGNYLECAAAKLEVTGLSSYFSMLVTATDTALRDDMVRLAVSRLSPLTADRILYVGDTPWDVRAARASGCGCLAVSTSLYSRQDLHREGATWIAPSLRPFSGDAWKFAFAAPGPAPSWAPVTAPSVLGGRS
ncbi:HAD family hydrolase [Myxococcota bacterium]|nr:HAD family hydrolase [Myxococcota bacterium]